MAKPTTPPGKNKSLTGKMREQEAQDTGVVVVAIKPVFSVDDIVLEVATIGTASIKFKMPGQ